MNDAISRQWLMECVEEGWIKFDTQDDENRFVHLIRDIAPSTLNIATNLQPTCNQLATDTISRQAVIDAVESVDWYHQNQHGEMVHGANPDDHQAWYKAEDIYKAVESVPSAQQWISCKERLPRQGQEVICQCRANMIKVLKLDADGDWYQDAEHCYMSGFVIAWCPLPEPWKGDKHEAE